MSAYEIERQAVFLIALAEAGIEADIQELLVEGNPSRGIAPGALGKALERLTSRPGEDAVERAFVPGPVWRETEEEEEEECWGSEVQTVGGHSVVATVYGANEQQVIMRRDIILAALSHDPQKEALVEAATEVLSYRVGVLPTRGWLQDTDDSRRALERLQNALSSTLSGGR